jgi:hypothetical protein
MHDIRAFGLTSGFQKPRAQAQYRAFFIGLALEALASGSKPPDALKNKLAFKVGQGFAALDFAANRVGIARANASNQSNHALKARKPLENILGACCLCIG